MLCNQLLDPWIVYGLSLSINLNFDSLRCVIVLVNCSNTLPVLHLLDVYSKTSDSLNAVLDLLR